MSEYAYCDECGRCFYPGSIDPTECPWGCAVTRAIQRRHLLPFPLMKRGDWTDPDELVLLLELYQDGRDNGRDVRSAARGLAQSLGRDSNAVYRAVWAFASVDQKAASGTAFDGLTKLATQVWNAFGADPREVRRLARQIRATRGGNLAKSSERVVTLANDRETDR